MIHRSAFGCRVSLSLELDKLKLVKHQTDPPVRYLRGLIFASSHFRGSSKGGIATGLPFQTRIIAMTRKAKLATLNKLAPVNLPEKTPPKVSSMLMAVIPICTANAWEA